MRNRQSLVLAALIVLLAVLVALLVSGGDETDGDDDSSAPSGPATSEPAADEPTQAPDEAFCLAFEALSAANNEHLANDTPATHDAVAQAGQQVLILAPDTDMSASAQEALWSAYSTDSCF